MSSVTSTLDELAAEPEEVKKHSEPQQPPPQKLDSEYIFNTSRPGDAVPGGIGSFKPLSVGLKTKKTPKRSIPEPVLRLPVNEDTAEIIDIQNKLGLEYIGLLTSSAAPRLESWLRKNDCDVRALIAGYKFNENIQEDGHMIITKTLAFHLDFWRKSQLCEAQAPGQILSGNSRELYRKFVTSSVYRDVMRKTHAELASDENLAATLEHFLNQGLIVYKALFLQAEKHQQSFKPCSQQIGRPNAAPLERLANTANLLRFKSYTMESVAYADTYLGICHQTISAAINQQMPELLRDEKMDKVDEHPVIHWKPTAGEGFVAVVIEGEAQCQAVIEAVAPDKRPESSGPDEKMLLQVPFDSLVDMREVWKNEEQRQLDGAPTEEAKKKIAEDPLAYWYDQMSQNGKKLEAIEFINKLPMRTQREGTKDPEFYLAVAVKKSWIEMNLDLYNAVFLQG